MGAEHKTQSWHTDLKLHEPGCSCTLMHFLKLISYEVPLLMPVNF